MKGKNLQYINELEKNDKLFEEKLNKFKKYQSSEIYTQQDDLEEDEDYYMNKRSSQKRPLNQEQSENSDDEDYSKYSKNKNKSTSSKKFKKENSYNFNYNKKEKNKYDYNDNE